MIWGQANDHLENKTNEQLAKAKLDTEFDEGSNFELAGISKQQVDNLYKLCKIWGFVKYHHPEIAKGNVNWDYELFQILPAINSENFNEDIYEWIEAIGPLNAEKIIKDKHNEIKLYPTTEWIYDEEQLTTRLSRKLIEVQKTTKEQSNYYIDFAENVGNPIFKNENPYPDMKWADTGYKILGLFRYWNMIEYFFPYKHLMDENWNNVLREFIPKIVDSQDEMQSKLIMLELIGKIQDTHANLWLSDFSHFHGEKVAPIEINIIENKSVVVKIFEQHIDNPNIAIGDIITEINGIRTEEIIQEKIKYCPASNYTAQLSAVAKKLLRTNEDSLNITIDNGDSISREKITTVDFGEIRFWENSIPSHKEIEEDIGYIYPGSLKKGEIDSIMVSFILKKGLIIDLRCYPSDFIVFSLGKYLMPKPTKFVKFTSSSIENPGEFSFGDTLRVGENNADYFKGKVIILVNEKTGSQPEYTAMAFRVAPQAIVLGSTTAGADGNVSRIVLPGNLKTMISGIGVYYPDGTETQRVGIISDIELKPTINGIRNGHDELIEKAIELINE